MAKKKPIQKKEPSIQEIHKFIASLVRYPFKRISKGCDADALLRGVLEIINKPFEKQVETDFWMEELASRYVRVNLHVSFTPQNSFTGLNKILGTLKPLNNFKGPMSHSHIVIRSPLDGDYNISVQALTTCSLGNTYLDDNYERMLLKVAMTFIYNVMYSGMKCSDEVALYAYQYLQKFYITDEKKELAR